MGSRGNDFPINAAYPLFDDSIPQREYDAAAAAEFYKKSGHDGSPIVLQVAPAAFPGAVEAAQLFQASANAAGIPLTVKLEPDDGYWCERLERGPVLRQLLGRASGAGPDVFDGLSVDRRLERHRLQGRAFRRVDGRGAGRAGSGQAQGHVHAKWRISCATPAA